MSKKNIKHQSGKQLYLNQIFYKGMLYTSSEMQEGFAKIIDNYDIAPTGDAASPRYPLIMQDISLGSDSTNIIPIQFKQDPMFSYVKFKRVISEEEFVSKAVGDTVTDGHTVSMISNEPEKQIRIVRRNKQEFVDSDQAYHSSESTSYLLYEEATQDNPTQDDSNDELIDEYKNYTETDPIISYDGGVTWSINIWRYIIPHSTGYLHRDPHTNYSTRYYKPTTSLTEVTIDTGGLQIIDGDTFYITSNTVKTKYRLYGIDTPETEKRIDEWGLYAKEVLTNILTLTDWSTYSLKLFKQDVTIDAYGRQVAKFYIGRVFNDKVLCLDISELLLYLGVGRLAYLTLPTENERYKTAANYALEHERKIYSDMDFDPYYELPIPNPNVDMFLLSEKDNLQLTPTQYIEAVFLSDEYSISAKTRIKTHMLSAKYIDYLDSLAFIGRIIETYNSSYTIVYKGLILLRCVLDSDNNPTYIIQLPSNQGDGVKPDIINATVTGSYNINNSNMINVSNNIDESKAFDIIGITALRTYNNILVEPCEVVAKAVAGQRVLLKAILNENGTYTYSNITTTDMFGFDVYVNPINISLSYTSGGESISEDYDLVQSKIIHREVGDSTNQTILSYNLDTIKANILQQDTDKKDAILTELGVTQVSDITWGHILASSRVFSLEKLRITKDNGDTYDISLNDKTISLANNYLSINPEELFTGSVLEMLAGGYENYNDNSDMVALVIFNNFSTINMTFNGTTTATVRSGSLPLKFYQQWYEAAYNDTNYIPISESKLIYTKPENSIYLGKTSVWTNSSGTIKPTDLYYNIGHTNVQIKYSIQPKIENKLSAECPSSLENLLLTNTYQEMYRIIPLLEISNTMEVISDASLRQNMDFKNATRLDVFNRQICLYGPHTISNVLFFSKFEVFDYFPFPSHVIELDEPITTVYNYKDALIVMGKYNIYMISGSSSILECKLNKIYENLSTHLADVNCLATSGNNMIFFNSGMGYVIVPNIYVDSSSNIKIYKLTEYISNFFYNPEEFIRLKFNYNINSDITYYMESKVYVENNNIVIAVNVEAFGKIGINPDDVSQKIVVWFVYDQNYKYWRTYSSKLFDEIKQVYICEPQLNNQFLVTHNNTNYIAYFKYLWGTEYSDKDMTGETITKQPICTTINSGYLSVDTMNDKRFKDIIIELDNINPEAHLDMACDFFVDGAPVLLSDTNVLVTDKTLNPTGATTDYELDDTYSSDVHHLFKEDSSNDALNQHKLFGKLFKIDNEVYGITGRTHIRIPVFGKGRLPLFTLQITSDKFYEFINYSMIYKEKNINRRS